MYQSLSFSVLGTLFIGILFLWQDQTTTINKYNNSIDISEHTTPAKEPIYYCDTIAIANRNIPDYNTALHLLNTKLSTCPTGTDGIDIITDFVYRILPMAGTADDEFPGYDLWKGLSFEQMYNYAYLPESGIYCGNRTIALRKQLYIYGYKDVIEMSYKSLHTFLLVSVNKTELQIADAWSPYYFSDHNTRIDFLEYLAFSKQGKSSVVIAKSERAFGVPVSILPDSLSVLIEKGTAQCGMLDSLIEKYQSMIPTYNTTEPAISRFFGYINTPKGIKYVIEKDDSKWLKRQAKLLGVDINEVWSNKQVSLNYSIPEFTDKAWATKTIQMIDSLRDLPERKN